MNCNNKPNPVQPLYAAPNTFSAGGMAATPAKPGKLLRLPAVEELTGIKKSTIYSGVKAGTFPTPVRLSARAVGFRAEDIDRWINERVSVGGQS